jgi:hypothetical protein
LLSAVLKGKRARRQCPAAWAVSRHVLFHGGGPPSLIPDVEERIRMETHLLEAAERGDSAAQFNLGIWYETD